MRLKRLEWGSEQAKKNRYQINRENRRSLYNQIGSINYQLDEMIEQAHLYQQIKDDRNLIKALEDVDRIAQKLPELKKELKGGDGLLKPVSTEDGIIYL